MLKQSLFYFSFTLGIVTTATAQFNPTGTDYKLVWQDEFDQEGKVNSEKWSFEEGFKRNNEVQWYQKENAEVKDGRLVITGKREQVKNSNFDPESTDWRRNREFAEYTSSSINTRGKYEFQYGIMEVRAKIDTALGMWPAIWTLGITKPWPANGEIDVMEYYRVKGEATILANAAWADEGQYNAKWDDAKIPFTDFLQKDPEWPSKFHLWRMEWTEDTIKLFLDDELLNEVDLARTVNPDGFNPFHQPHYILLNLAIGGNNGGDPTYSAFPREYAVDYVRVYQK
ncbi:Glycosyl hydrolases family 16 [Algoriphagus locisalis]|uniref:Glycosyl hydrolases family 16 n=1 Tax=Algoriphagus locisalis TaxID=305507 RepID=A0A1I7CQB7_9BACT|nr:glycoside hydrolase family 16 protein [Algoriphagus locisalis]SFU01554.1 Glycosyl hydrolases family 16 [Algoriphagus locisalis]